MFYIIEPENYMNCECEVRSVLHGAQRMDLSGLDFHTILLIVNCVLPFYQLHTELDNCSIFQKHL